MNRHNNVSTFNFRSCLKDTCAESCPGGIKCGCAALREYASDCALRGVKGQHRSIVTLGVMYLTNHHLLFIWDIWSEIRLLNRIVCGLESSVIFPFHFPKLHTWEDSNRELKSTCENRISISRLNYCLQIIFDRNDWDW